jgi:hypothetical protein
MGCVWMIESKTDNLWVPLIFYKTEAEAMIALSDYHLTYPNRVLRVMAYAPCPKARVN